MLPIFISYHLQSSSLVIDGATSTSHRAAQTIIYLELKVPERITNAGISYLRDKYVASAIEDGQRRLQMIANKNGEHIEPYLETHN
jgi:hypothetical protein